MPQGATSELGPDATGLGWIFQYVLTDTTGTHTLSELRSYQDWYLRYHLKSVRGVADVASVGGYVRQYQVNVNPNRLRAYGLPISRVVDAVRSGNSDAGGRVLEFGGAEYMVRGLGYARSAADLENIALGASGGGAPIPLKEGAAARLGPQGGGGRTALRGGGGTGSGIRG